MEVKPGELFPIISPFGFSAKKRSTRDSMIRFAARGDKRKPWNALFFLESPEKTLAADEAGEYALPLEMVRLGPSASNKQPWRIVKADNQFHFFKEASLGYAKALGFDIQSIDMGIAMCHFHLAAIGRRLPGSFSKLANTPAGSDGWTYHMTWIAG